MTSLSASPVLTTSAWFVPGRVELLGKHTDYAGGRSLLAAVDLGHTVTARAREDRVLRVVSSLSEDAVELDLDAPAAAAPAEDGHWSGYVRTVAARLDANFPGILRGAEVEITSTLPPAAGMSSSSALIVGLALVLIDLSGIAQDPRFVRAVPDREHLAEYLGTLENGQSFGELAGDRGVGTFGGSEDHTAMLCAPEGGLVQYSFCPVQREREVPFPEGHCLVIAVSGVEAHKTGAAREDYNRISLAAAEILRRWNLDRARMDPTLAAAVATAPTSAAAIAGLVAGEDYLPGRLEQFLAESERLVPAAAVALEDGDLEELGRLVDESQAAAEQHLGNQVPETIALQRTARSLGAVAASAFGAGFGGSVWALVPDAQADAFVRDWEAAYLAAFPQHRGAARVLRTRPGRAAHRREVTA
ncbi:galactokinase family protein [Brachybacterium phenoliresistens]|uniref:galactokinase family protein n=1 Tax=Brachybacterium phenoliresistens TaxID=396014 RepID=UPI0004AE9B51|nr:galactokinase family protein [Brachybacterium phenoliresistens]